MQIYRSTTIHSKVWNDDLGICIIDNVCRKINKEMTQRDMPWSFLPLMRWLAMLFLDHAYYRWWSEEKQTLISFLYLLHLFSTHPHLPRNVVHDPTTCDVICLPSKIDLLCSWWYRKSKVIHPSYNIVDFRPSMFNLKETNQQLLASSLIQQREFLRYCQFWSE